MSNDPLGHDPLGLDGAPVIAQRNNVSKSREMLAALRQGIVMRGVYIAQRSDRGLAGVDAVGDAIGQDGQTLTLADRQAIAAGRRPYVPLPFGQVPTETLADGTTVSISYNDGAGPAPEPLGESAQKAINEMPEIRLHGMEYSEKYKDAPVLETAPTVDEPTQQDLDSAAAAKRVLDRLG